MWKGRSGMSKLTSPQKKKKNGHMAIRLIILKLTPLSKILSHSCLLSQSLSLALLLSSTSLTFSPRSYSRHPLATFFSSRLVCSLCTPEIAQTLWGQSSCVHVRRVGVLKLVKASVCSFPLPPHILVPVLGDTSWCFSHDPWNTFPIF